MVILVFISIILDNHTLDNLEMSYVEQCNVENKLCSL